jgi:hypothetical protein
LLRILVRVTYHFLLPFELVSGFCGSLVFVLVFVLVLFVFPESNYVDVTGSSPPDLLENASMIYPGRSEGPSHAQIQWWGRT